MVQVPAATRVTVPFVTVHTVGVDELKLTAKPELDVAFKAKELLPKGKPGSGPKLMVCVVWVKFRSVTDTGVFDRVVLPLPSWPLAFMPQHSTPPALVRAQE
jgi:hypothetical protein